MRVTVTGATGRIGTKLVEQLKRRGDEVTVLSRDPERAARALAASRRSPGARRPSRRRPRRWPGATASSTWPPRTSASAGPRRSSAGSCSRASWARATSSKGCAPRTRARARWSPPRRSAGTGRTATRCSTRTSPRAATSSPACASCGSARRRPPASSGCASCCVRTPGLVLGQQGGALARMLPFFKLGVGGPVASGASTCPGSTGTTWSTCISRRSTVTTTGAGRSTRPRRSRSPTRSSPRRWAGRCTARPSCPCPGSRCSCSTARCPPSSSTGQRAIPKRTEALGFRFRHRDLDEALRSALDAG